MTMQLTTHGNLYGLLLDDGVELVGDGYGMTLDECRMWADKIENESRQARSLANPQHACNSAGCLRVGF